MVEKGLLAAGYKYVQVDCGWQAFNRDANGFLTHDTDRFPDGIASLSDYVHSKGFKWGMYQDAGVYTCDTSTPLRPGSLNYEDQDAKYFLSVNTDMLKYDNCYVTANNNAPKDPDPSFDDRYGAMRQAIDNNGGRNKMALHICQWGTPFPTEQGLVGPQQWTPAISNGYRLSDDIAKGWANVARILNQSIHIMLSQGSGPGAFADADMLEVGSEGMTIDEQASHFAYWAFIKSPLMIGTDLTNASQDVLNILSNKRIIAINQDPLGKPVTLVQRWTNDRDLFSGPLSNGDQAVLVMDLSNTARSLSVTFAELGIVSADVENLVTGQKQTGVKSYSANVGARGSLPLRLSNVKSADAVKPAITWYEAESGTMSGGAASGSCSGCSGSSKVVNLGGDSSFTLNGVAATSTSATVYFDYINAEVGYLAEQGPNARGATISVNGGAAQQVGFPLSGYNWDSSVLKNFKVKLDGFRAGSDNTIRVSPWTQASPYAPDFDRIGVVQ